VLALTIVQEREALEPNLTISDLERMAQETWRDSLSWLTLQKLLVAHQKTIVKTQNFLSGLEVHLKINKNDIKSSTTSLRSTLDELKELEDIVSGDFKDRGQSISDLVH
jgi:hypothetical protein